MDRIVSKGPERARAGQTALQEGHLISPCSPLPGHVSAVEVQEHYDNFFEMRVSRGRLGFLCQLIRVSPCLLQEVFTELQEKYGEIEEMNGCDNPGDHLMGNVYVKVLAASPPSPSPEMEAFQCLMTVTETSQCEIHHQIKSSLASELLSSPLKIRSSAADNHPLSPVLGGGGCRASSG